MDPVFFALPGVNASAPQETSVFQSDAKPDFSAYKIPPPVWIIVFLTLGYIGLRYIMED